MEMECNNHSDVRMQFDVHNQEIQKKFSSTPWPWAYFTNGPNAAASIAPTLIRHWQYRSSALNVLKNIRSITQGRPRRYANRKLTYRYTIFW